MDFHLKQWRDEQEDELSDEQPAKFPRIQDNHHQQHPALPLFAPPHDESPPPTKINYSYPDSKPPLPPTSSRFQSRFSMIQWQELELQALIFRHMVAGASVPPELLHLVKKSLVDSSSRYSYYQPSLLQAAAGYWGRGAMDPEPGRCRRTDGKKWRCSRDVVAGHKYCERHVHRGRNRSRKPVEFPVPATITTTTHAGGGAGTQKSHHQSSAFGGLSGSLDIFQLNQGASSEPKSDNSKLVFESQHDTSGEGKYNGRVLRHFFDDWPRSDNTNEGAASQANPATNLSISTPVTNSSLDFLKLSTGNGEAVPSRTVDGNQNASVWSTDNHVAAMGGPLAEALRSSTGSSPTSVLNQIPRSLSDTSYVTARV